MATFTALLTFTRPNGVEPNGSLAADGAGDLFGTTSSGGASNNGTVFELVNQGGSYTLTTLVSFNGSDGNLPGGGLILDASGNLFGTTTLGGTGGAKNFASGTVFEVAKTANGYASTPQTLANFTGANGSGPGGLVPNAAGDLFGTTSYGGGDPGNAGLGSGTIFEIPKTSSGYAAPVTLYGFRASDSPVRGLAIDPAGDLFGATNSGTVYELARTTNGYAAVPTTISTASIGAPLTTDEQGDLFGLDGFTLFEIPKTTGSYAGQETVLASLSTTTQYDASGGGVIVDAAGNVFVVTNYGKNRFNLPDSNGLIFEIAKTATGYASKPIVFAHLTVATGLLAGSADGSAGGLTADATGNLFGTTQGGLGALGGSSASAGSVFELTGTGFATTPATASVVDAGGTTHTVSFGLDALAKLAQPLLAAPVPANTLFTATGADTMAAGQTAAVDDATGPVSLTGNSAANEAIIAGGGNFSFDDGGGSGTIVAGAGNDVVSLTGGGNWSIAMGNGTDSVEALAGSDTIITGHASTHIDLGTGPDLVVSLGNDTVVAGAGAATIAADGGSDLVGGTAAPLTFIGGTGSNTLIGGTGSTTLIGGTSGGTLMFGNGRLQYTGYGASDTIAGLSGSTTVQAGPGGGQFFGGSAGNNVITTGSGNVTAIGGGGGDVLSATGAASNLFAGGTGAETLTGAGSTGSNTFFAGSGPETLVGGNGNTAMVAGVGADLLAGGSGLTLFLFAQQLTAGSADTVTGFDPTHDFIKLLGYSGDAASVLQEATVANGATTIALSDGTHVTFTSVTQLGVGSFA